MVDLREGLQHLEFDWAPCRINGPCYGTMNQEGTLHLPKKWLVRTRDMKDNEMSPSKLSKDHQDPFARAKLKEVHSFVKAAAAPKNFVKPMRARRVLTWKSSPPEDVASGARDAATNGNAVYTKDGRCKARARVVLLGFEHPNLLRPEFCTSSPVCSTLGRNLT